MALYCKKKKKSPYRQYAWWSCGYVPCFRYYPSSSLWPLCNIFLVGPFRTISEILCLWDQATLFFLSLAPYCGSTVSSQIHENYSTKVGVFNHLVIRPPTPTFLWVSILIMTMWLWRMWVTSSASWPKRRARVSGISQRCRTSVGCIFCTEVIPRWLR